MPKQGDRKLRWDQREGDGHCEHMDSLTENEQDVKLVVTEELVDEKGFEPSTPALRTRCSPS